MKIAQLTDIMDEAGVSPENLSQWLGISNMTLRRWFKRPPDEEIPKEYDRAIAGGIHQMLAQGQLSHDGAAVNNFLNHNLPEFFQAAIGRFNVAEDVLDAKSPHQDRITATLAQIGNSSNVRRRIDSSGKKLTKFGQMGESWKQRITLLVRMIRAKELTLVDKLVAYGALFYLLTPIDLIPDQIPVFGLVDDFGILGFAVIYYQKTFGALIADLGAA
jgi:uncharacterized membrane protein YkvA (DUF1232 family)